MRRPRVRFTVLPERRSVEVATEPIARPRLTVRHLIAAAALAALATSLATRRYYDGRSRSLLIRAEQIELRGRHLQAEIQHAIRVAEVMEEHVAEAERHIEGMVKMLVEQVPPAIREPHIRRLRSEIEPYRERARASRARLPGLRARHAHWSQLHAKYVAAARAPWRPMPPDPPEPE